MLIGKYSNGKIHMLGAIFGAAKCFRDFKGILWYATDNCNKAKMAIVANLCMIPSWLLVSYTPTVVASFEQDGSNEYIFNAVHYSVLFYFQFGVLPYYVFRRWGWTRSDNDAKVDPEKENLEFVIVEQKVGNILKELNE